MGWVWLGWAGLGLIGVGLGWVGLDWAGAGARLSWAGLGEVKHVCRSSVACSVQALGLSPLHITAYVLLSCTIVGVLFAFIFFAMGGWFQEDAFGAVVQSVLVTASARVGTALRAQAKGENADEVNALVDEIMDDHNESATGD